MTRLNSLRRKFFPEPTAPDLVNHAVAEHVANAFLSAPVVTDPWQYVFVENVFPVDFYQEIVDAFARSENSFKEQVHDGDKKVFYGNYGDREQFKVVWPDVGQQDPNPDPFWTELYGVLNSEEFFGAMRKRFEPQYRERFGAFLNHPRFKEHIDPSLLITRHRENYYLGPHTDRAEKLVTCIFNFAEKQGIDDLGTGIYVPKEKGFTSDGLVHLNPELFDYAGVSPFRPNSVLIFYRTDISFHGVERLTKESMQGSRRNNVQYNLWDWSRRPAA